MTLAIHGDRASCLTLQLGPGTWLLAVARGFGRIGGIPTETALLERLRRECERRMRSPLFRRAVDRPQAAATAILAVLARVNGSLHASTPSHEDYVTAAASLTAVVVVQRSAYVMHAGSTAAYLARGRDIVPLSADDALEERGVPVLTRAFAVAPNLDVSVANVRLVSGDAIVLLGRRIGDERERDALLERLEASEPGEHVLVARFEDEPSGEVRAATRPRGIAALAARILAGIGLLTAAVFGR